ncbi:hypothetical protein ANO11243_049050 [Dothideomycetidae sp. 11243]|nr:hypothetical protein ANO11243_049050 [fungal sp. No.11243]
MSNTSSLGKRKRAIGVASKNTDKRTQVAQSSDDEQDVSAIFRRAFEAKFKPLPEQKPKQAEDTALGNASDEEDSAWSGISSKDETGGVVEVIEHDFTQDTKTESLSKSEMRAFMSSKPPSARITPSTSHRVKSTRSDGDEDGTEAANLKNDLALQRLLRESHLLDSSDASEGPSGRNRLKATELRLQSLGAKTSILDQKSMPMSHRKGMAAKAARKETERRQEAKENGIVLERPQLGKRKESSRRERTIGGPSIGKFRGGTLSLSKKDVQGIQGSGSRRGGKTKSRGRR